MPGLLVLDGAKFSPVVQSFLDIEYLMGKESLDS